MEMTDLKENDKPAQIVLSIDSAMKTVSRVEDELAARGLKCHTGSALGSLFAMVRRLANNTKPMKDSRWRTTFLRANEAVRIAYAVEAALKDPGAQEAIHRVTDTDMNLATRQMSMGKDALWELDLYRRLQLGGASVRFEEPDLVVSLGEGVGDYAIACKKVYSQDNVANSFKKGCEQLAEHKKPGIVAFNLDDLAPENTVWTASTKSALKQSLDEMNRKFIYANQVHFRSALERGDCDGVLVCTSVISDVLDMTPRINMTRSTAVWNSGTGQESQLRFGLFRHGCLDNAIAKLAQTD